MSGNRAELWSAPDTLRPDHSDRSAEHHAAVLAVLHRVDTGTLTRAEALRVLQALGLADTPLPPKPLSTRQRQRLAQRQETP